MGRIVAVLLIILQFLLDINKCSCYTWHMRHTKRKSKPLTLGFQTDRALLDRVDRLAEGSNVSRSDVLRWAVLEWLKQHEKVA